uniref:Succinate dehydrogenase assembly factor 2, mitochondrial n=1 Tax=Ciona intestinalis TaxID=7719 RepID=F7ARN8_CIOIN|nr:succinate dehydrogenase assembly factor 2, mitochondrial-like [Ciona intestinalis]|eukprot:XP_002124208.1 succinate dehydrogenase assembly factor 2, mitochondrial-like [Ciona intestinalis]
MSVVRCTVVYRSLNRGLSVNRFKNSQTRSKSENTSSDVNNLSIPEKSYANESITKKRARLHWQSRKRGISENCLIFSTFAAKYLNSFSPEQIEIYDKILNKPNNDWDVYYWMVGTKNVPNEYQSEIMDMLQEHCRNNKKEERFIQPALEYEPVPAKES